MSNYKWYRKIGWDDPPAYEVLCCPVCGKALWPGCPHDVMEEVRIRVNDKGIPLDEGSMTHRLLTILKNEGGK